MDGRTLDFLRNRKKAYQLVFAQPAGQIILTDLSGFCRATSSCFHRDPRLHAVLEGRREVWLRITQHLHLTSQELYQLYGGKTLPMTRGEEDDG